MPWLTWHPNLSSWRANKDRDKEIDGIEDTIDSNKRLCEPPEFVSLYGQKYPENQEEDG